MREFLSRVLKSFGLHPHGFINPESAPPVGTVPYMSPGSLFLPPTHPFTVFAGCGVRDKCGLGKHTRVDLGSQSRPVGPTRVTVQCGRAGCQCQPLIHSSVTFIFDFDDKIWFWRKDSPLCAGEALESNHDSGADNGICSITIISCNGIKDTFYY